MKRKTKIILAFIAAIIFFTVALTLLVTARMSGELEARFQHNSEKQLRSMSDFIDQFFAAPIAQATELAANRIIIENLDALTAYRDRTDSFTIREEDLPPRERRVYEELVKINRRNPAYDLVYVGNSRGGFTETLDDYGDIDGLLIGFDPTTRPWFTKALAEKRTVIVDAYLSNTGRMVCTLAAPVRGRNGQDLQGAVGIDIRLDTLTEEAAKATVGQTGYVILIDNGGKVVCDPRNSGPEVPEENHWLGKTIGQLPAEASAALERVLAQPDGRAEVDLGGRHWLTTSARTKYGWRLIFLQEKREVFFDAVSTAIRLVALGLIIIVTLLIILLALFPNKRPPAPGP